MKKLLKVITAVLLLAAASAPLFSQSQTETLTVLMDPGNDEIILNPYTAFDSNSIVVLLNLYDGLFSYDSETSGPVSAIAEAYSVSDDGLTWTFKLRKAGFSDGESITSQTFSESWNYMKDGPLGSNLDFVARRSDGSLDLETPDESTLVVNLRYAVPYLPGLLCQPCLAAIKDTTSYSGAYTLTSRSEDKITLSRNPYYWDTTGIDSVDIILGEGNDRLLLDGDAQWSMAAVADAADYMVLSRLYATTFFYFSATEGAYADPNIRKALIDVIPWDLVRSTQGSLEESSSIVPYSGAGTEIDVNIAALLAEGGYPYGQKSLPVIRMAMTRGSLNATSADLIARLWSATLGITVTMDTVPITLFTSVPEENPYDLFLITWIGDYFDPMAFLSLFASDNSFNLANFSDDKFDALLTQAAFTSDELERRSILIRAEQVLLDSGTVIPMSTAFATNFVRNDMITGWTANPLDIHPFKTIRFID